jgi:hypothetical protein
MVLEEARQWLATKGYNSGREHPYDEGQAWLFQANGKPDLLLCAVDPDKSIDEHQGQLAVLAALTACGDTPPPYVHVTNGTNASTFHLTNEGRPLLRCRTRRRQGRKARSFSPLRLIGRS